MRYEIEAWRALRRRQPEGAFMIRAAPAAMNELALAEIVIYYVN
jgi:hypothetical protein